jgi:hypothetical protein
MKLVGMTDNPIHQIVIPYTGVVFVQADPRYGRLYVKPQEGMTLRPRVLDTGEVVIEVFATGLLE